MRFGNHFGHSAGALLQRLGPSVRRRPANRLLPFTWFAFLLALIWLALAPVLAAVEFIFAWLRRCASAARHTGASFVGASAWATRPAASGSPIGSLQQFLGALRVVGVSVAMRLHLPQLCAVCAYSGASRRVGSYPSLSLIRGLSRFGCSQHNQHTVGRANHSFNRTGNG